MRALIIGAGLGGLCLANGLHKNGHGIIDVRVFERHPSPAADLGGYFIHLERQGLQALRRCLPRPGWENFLKVATPTGAKWAFRDAELNLLAMRDDVKISGRSVEEVGRYAIERWELRGVLLDALGSDVKEVVRWGKEFLRYEELEDGRVCAYFTDGTSEVGDLLIGADGSKSVVRGQRFPDMKRVDLGIVPICGRYLLTASRAEQMPSFMTDCSLNNVVPYGKGWMFLSSWRSRTRASADSKKDFDSSEHRPTQRDLNESDYALWAYFVPKHDTPFNIKTMSAAELRDLVLEGIADWTPPIQTVVRDADLDTISPIFLHCAPHLEEWPSSRIALLGDAIHSMTPAAGIGANTALRDAQILTDLFVEALRGDDAPQQNEEVDVVERVIARYEVQMRPYANAAVSLSQQIAESAASTSIIERILFRIVLRLAQILPFVMRATIGRGAVQE